METFSPNVGDEEKCAFSIFSEVANDNDQECMNDGSDESTANTIACERVLGKTKRLGLGCSSSKKGARSNLSSVARDEEIAALKEDNQTLKDEMNQMQSTMKAMVEYFRAQGVEFHPQNPPGDDN
ncbi:PREDICTED: uncharacterized protein LOC105950936 [Erythranthe guttata]|uniref:uncharacterized protein LOC105950936 n=1 Tax=Erythranthe guttata TaxID=4155 RepID=UPI00064E02CE|nr:PREDICTED: uncharacterized protein LOC105950936 [Erythranthe guttata]|eukprot:XP_012829777.1 PREDICTED: uncharacterized protein LOC105950936 [Erythranthe guttata]